MKNFLPILIVLFAVCSSAWATWYWLPAEKAHEKLLIMEADGHIDTAAEPMGFEELMAHIRDESRDVKMNDEDYTPERFAQRGWAALGRKDYAKAKALALWSWERYKDEALRIQSHIEESGLSPDYGRKEYAALDRLGECLFMLGDLYYYQEKYREAEIVYREIIARYSHSSPLSK